MKNLYIFALSIFLFGAFGAASLSAADSRYALAKTKDGTIRLDKKSGAVSYCRKVSGGIACSMAADEREAWIKATDEMADRMDELEKRIAHLEAVKDVEPNGADETKSKSKEPLLSNKEAPLLSETEERHINKAMRVGEVFLRRFIGVVKELKNDLQTD